jgi:hypothetical protein
LVDHGQARRTGCRKTRSPPSLRRNVERIRAKSLSPCRREKPLGSESCARTKTATGGQVENTKAIERTLVKELGKMAP